MKNTTFTILIIAATLVVLPKFSFAQVTFRFPVNTGTAINSYFDNNLSVAGTQKYDCSILTTRSDHMGVDIPVPTGTAVLSAAAGRIYYKNTETNGCPDVGSLSSSCGGGFGNHYRVDHEKDTNDGSGLISIYAHMKNYTLTTPIGTPISCGQQLGLSAASGHVTGPHLHFELDTNGVQTSIDPFTGACSHTSPPSWTSVAAGQPTTICDNHPLAPSNVTITSPTASSLKINFKDNALNETNILLERKRGTNGAYTQIFNFAPYSGATTTSWTNSGLYPGTEYCYRLRSQNGTLYSNIYSNEACGTTTNTSPIPLAPSNVTISNPTTSSLVVNFKDNAINETNVLVERKTGTTGNWGFDGGFGVLSDASSWSWTNSSLWPGTTYCYRLKTITATGSSAYSGEACGTTTNTSPIPLAPSNVTITNPIYPTNATTISMQINFKDNATNETNVLLERKLGTSGGWVSVGSLGTLTDTSNWKGIDTYLESKKTYCYRLRAITATGSSTYSTQACGTTW